MKKFATVTTFYCKNCQKPTNEILKDKFNYDGDTEDLFINFSNDFDPWNIENIPNVGISRRKDLVYGKIFKLKEFIESNILNKYEYLVHIDYSDTKFSRSCIEMFNHFINSGKDLIISTEKICWPYLETVSSWVNQKIEDKEFYYINSGAIISKTNKFYDIICKLENICLNEKIDFWDDQGVWQYYNIKYENLEKDEICDYFFSTALLDETYYKIENKRIITKFETEPYLIHDNSSFSLNLTKKINNL
jgi:hypothetical protein